MHISRPAMFCFFHSMQTEQKFRHLIFLKLDSMGDPQQPKTLSSSSSSEEPSSFLSSLYDQLLLEGVGLPRRRRAPPDLRFLIRDAKLDTHSLVLRQYCLHLPSTLGGEVDDDGDLKVVTGIGQSLGVTADDFQMFRKAVYLNQLDPPSFDPDALAGVRKLAEYFGCQRILELCDGGVVSLENCHLAFIKWPVGSLVQMKAQELIKRNLKTLVETDKTLDWDVGLWRSVLSWKDLTPPIPSADDLFKAALNWQNKNKINADTFHSLFRDCFRLPPNFNMPTRVPPSGTSFLAQEEELISQREEASSDVFITGDVDSNLPFQQQPRVAVPPLSKKNGARNLNPAARKGKIVVRPRGWKQYRCVFLLENGDACGKIYGSPGARSNHVNEEHRKVTYPCRKRGCGRRFSRIANRNRHEESMHTKRLDKFDSHHHHHHRRQYPSKKISGRVTRPPTVLDL